MNRIHFSSIIFVAFAALAILSCKKKEEETLPYLEGNLKINGVEVFISADSDQRTLTLKPSGAKHPEEKTLGYYWKVSPTMTRYDTTRYENGLNKNGQPSDGSFTYTIEDSLGTYTIYCYAYASGYNGLSASARTTVVRGGVQVNDNIKVSITNTEIATNGTPLDETEYYYATIGSLDWTLNNMADKSVGVGFLNNDAMSDVYGRYYSYDEAKAICAALPADEGNTWRLPTDEDWVNMVKSITTDATDFTPEVHTDIYWDSEKNGKPTLAARLIADACFNNIKMWDYWPEIGVPTNSSTLAILPVGYANLGVTPEITSKSAYPAALFEGTYEFAAFWTADEVADDTNLAYYRYMYQKSPHLMISKGFKSTFGASVRCVRDAD